MTRREWALSLFELPPNATEAQVKEVYRDLIAVWHPDKHNANERLRLRAEAMTKRINEARDILLGRAEGWSKNYEHYTSSAPPDEEDEPPIEEDEVCEEPEEEPAQPSTVDQTANRPRSHSKALAIGTWLFAGSVSVWLLWSAFANNGHLVIPRSVGPGPTLSSNVVDPSPPLPAPLVTEANTPTEEPTQNEETTSTEPGPDEHYFVVLMSLKRKNEARAVAACEGVEWNGQEAFVLDTDGARRNGFTELTPGLMSVTVGPYDRETARRGATELSGKYPGAFVINLGDTEVSGDAAVPHSTTPTQSDEGTPAKSTATPGTFTLGSTKEEVRAIQGTPTRVSYDTWWYGSDSVDFENDLVDNFSNSGGSLKVSMTTASKAAESFGLGSSKDHVLAIQGTPTRVSYDTWWYHTDNVGFDNGLVNGYSNSGGLLKVSMTAKRKTTRITFRVGSTKDEVLAIQGTPSRVSYDTWWWGSDNVSFENGMVESYSNSSRNLKIE